MIMTNEIEILQRHATFGWSKYQLSFISQPSPAERTNEMNVQIRSPLPSIVFIDSERGSREESCKTNSKLARKNFI